MSKFRKKPVVVEAVQYGVSLPRAPFRAPVPDWIDAAYDAGLLTNLMDECGHYLRVTTLEGDVEARPGTWIVRGVKDEIYPVRGDIFMATYEVVR